jgi:arylsulfatase
VRDQFLHVIDLAPTLMDLAGDRHAGKFDGASFRLTLNNGNVPAPRNSQHWEMFGRRAIYCDGWKAVTEHEKGDDYGADTWRLYDTGTDFSECHDIAAQHPEKLREMQDIWWQEAESNDVLPLDDRSLVDIIVFRQPNGLMSEREITLHPGQGHVPQLSMITASERSMEVTAHFSSGWDGQEGVLISSGESLGGYTLYISDGQLWFEHVRMGHRAALSGPVAKGAKRCSLVLHVSDDMSATARLFCDRRQVSEGAIPKVSSHLSFWGLDVGRDSSVPVSARYDAPFIYPEPHLDRVVMRFFDEVEINKLAATLEAAE